MRNFLLSILVVNLLGYGTVLAFQYDAKKQDAIRGEAGCKRNVLDRTGSARIFMGHDRYLESVVLAQSVREDVKIAARRFKRILDQEGAGLAERAKVPCDSLYERPSLIFGWQP